MTDTTDTKSLNNLDKLINSLGKIKGKEIQTNIKPKTYKPKEQYAIVFIASLLQIFIAGKLTKTEILVLLGYAQLMEFGNHISISQKDVSKITGIAQPNIARAIKKLKDVGLFYSPETAPNSLYVNPAFIAKGDLRQFKSQIEGLQKMLPPDDEQSLEDLMGISPQKNGEKLPF